jgi:hypothetical protein
MARYFHLWTIALLALLCGAVVLNYWVDPYGLYRPYKDGDWKPHATTQGALIKPYRVLDAQAQTLVLGNSRAEVGFDPEDTAWPMDMRPVYNLALPGTGTRTTRRLFEHVLAAHPPRHILLGLDLMDFLVPEDARGEDPIIVKRLLASGDAPNEWRWLTRLHDGASTLASLDTLIHSLDTLRLRGAQGVAHLTPGGFNPMHDYEVMARKEGYFALFRQRDVENMRAYLRRPRNLFSRGTSTSPTFDDVRAILDAARARGIAVQVVIYPYHAHLLETFHLTGLWPLFETWKRELTHLVASVGREHATLWDFSGYHDYAREAVPTRSDRTSEVRWYWEAGHFKKELGHVLLRQVFEPGISGPGVVLTQDNIEAHLASLRRQGVVYRSEHAESIRFLEKLLP